MVVEENVPSPSLTPLVGEEHEEISANGVLIVTKNPIKKRNPGGWKAMPYILGNETCERLATFGLLANFMVYLVTQFHLDQGMLAITLTASIPTLRPPKCTGQQLEDRQCEGPTTAQLSFLFVSLALCTLGASGIRPCSIPFGVDQFDSTTEAGRKGVNSFFNWYYFSLSIVMLVSLTIIVYIQSNISWAIGLSIPMILMFFSLALFFLGTRIYVYVPPGGSILSRLVQVFVAAYKKRNIKLPRKEDLHEVLYDPLLKETSIKLPLTYSFSCLNKAAVVEDGDLKEDGTNIDPWRLCTVQQVEEVKCLARIVPIWIANIICFISMTQLDTITVLQAMKMDRRLGNFNIPAGSIGVISLLTMVVWIPIYDQIVVPVLSRITKIEGGITLLVRMGIGMVFAILQLVVAGFIEEKRRASALAHAGPDGVAPFSVMWLIPQIALNGFANSFNVIGQIEFYYKQFPDNMKSIGNSLFFCTMAGGSYLSTLLVTIVHNSTGKHGHLRWLDSNVNSSRIDYFYFLIAAIGTVNLMYFLVCAQGYHYKVSTLVRGEDDIGIELNTAVVKPLEV
ncbi:hypothetical protein GIB67_032993 [Kingdonia uniflora]|uniref:Uncharacterized protein n=1 Tax=Kingdonia uniflora TaxID=39325 RepID=A0A7J7MY78_9MAGN|nr:hypothetical protein GIB67_032993 [Kingdonia uniflora]